MCTRQVGSEKPVRGLVLESYIHICTYNIDTLVYCGCCCVSCIILLNALVCRSLCVLQAPSHVVRAPATPLSSSRDENMMSHAFSQEGSVADTGCTSTLRQSIGQIIYISIYIERETNMFNYVMSIYGVYV